MWLAATAVILVLLLGYKTSTGGATPAPPAQPPGVVVRAAGSPGPGASGQPDGQDGRAVVVNGRVARTGGRYRYRSRWPLVASPTRGR